VDLGGLAVVAILLVSFVFVSRVTEWGGYAGGEADSSDAGRSALQTVQDAMASRLAALPGIGPSTGINPGDLSSAFLEGAASRLGLGALPPEALPAAARAYRAQFGHGMDQDLPYYQADVEEWLVSWKAAYDAGAPWAKGMAAK
jgi:hypothetical protein